MNDISLLILRLWVGLNMAFAHGWGKITDPSGFLANEALLDFPAPVAMGWFAILAEFIGGLMVAAGLLTRVSALAIAGTMFGAAFVVHGGDAWSSKEKALCYAVMSLVLVMKGGGKYGAVGIWKKRKAKAVPAEAAE